MTGERGASGRVLVVMRHAKSDWSGGELADFDRPLSARGRRDAPRMGRWLVEQGLAPACVLASPARRARDTTLAIVQELPAAAPIAWEPRLYAAELVDLLAVLAAAPQASPLLLVGHNPGLEELVRWLLGSAIGEVSADGKIMPTAGVVALAMPQDWARLPAGSARLRTAMRPRALP